VLAPGADADVILLDADLNVRLTMVAGQVVYQDI
jgi:N-acetylglucosamine-6-phosphate deacetylase